MTKAIWNGAVIAESDACKIVEDNAYFPPDAIHLEYFQPSQTHSFCNWKGEASYYDIVVAGQTNPDAAWYYPNTMEKAKPIEGYVAFWKGVQIAP